MADTETQLCVSTRKMPDGTYSAFRWQNGIDGDEMANLPTLAELIAWTKSDPAIWSGSLIWLTEQAKRDAFPEDYKAIA